MCELSGWLFRSKKSPWGTHATGNNLSEGCLRYLQVATSSHEESSEPDPAIEPQDPYAKAEAGDALMQLFGRDILKERLGDSLMCFLARS